MEGGFRKEAAFYFFTFGRKKFKKAKIGDLIFLK